MKDENLNVLIRNYIVSIEQTKQNENFYSYKERRIKYNKKKKI